MITYEELVSEERTRQVAAAVLVGLAAGANAAAASQAGYYSHNTTVYTPRGTYTATTTGYSPAAAAIAQSNAAAQNEAMIGATIERGQQNLAMLEQAVMKDNTLLPGEWYGGQLHLQPLASTSYGRMLYRIAMMVGPDGTKSKSCSNRRDKHRRPGPRPEQGERAGRRACCPKLGHALRA